MNLHAQHYNEYLFWKRKALVCTLAVLAACLSVHGFVYYRLFSLQNDLAATKALEHNADKITQQPHDLEKIVALADEQQLYRWVSALVHTIPALVKVEALQYHDGTFSVTLVTCDRAAWQACLEFFASHVLLQRLHVGKQYVKDKQYCFIMKSIIY